MLQTVLRSGDLDAHTIARESLEQVQHQNQRFSQLCVLFEGKELLIFYEKSVFHRYFPHWPLIEKNMDDTHSFLTCDHSLLIRM